MQRLLGLGLMVFLVLGAADLSPAGEQPREENRNQDPPSEPSGETDRDRDRIQDRTGDCDPACPGLVDADGDGICDGCHSATDPDQDRDRDRIRDRTKDCDSVCPGFVDEDEDGICDHCRRPDGEDHPERPGRRRFLRGDVNGDGQRDISDAIGMLHRLFGQGGAFPCPDAADVTDDGTLDAADPILLLQELFGHRRACGVAPPWRNRGEDPTADELGCE